MATVTKANLARILIKNQGLSRKQAYKAVDTFFESMRKSILMEERIEIRGFGVWTIKNTKSKPNARNPRTGEIICVPARKKVSFRPGKILKNALFKSLEA